MSFLGPNPRPTFLYFPTVLPTPAEVLQKKTESDDSWREIWGKLGGGCGDYSRRNGKLPKWRKLVATKSGAKGGGDYSPETTRTEPSPSRDPITFGKKADDVRARVMDAEIWRKKKFRLWLDRNAKKPEESDWTPPQ